MLEADRPREGLRERKKARTRASIQDHALRLIRKSGYEATTVDDIAEAAEVSPSTFFRYFPTKEDVVLYDDLDPVLFEVFARQPPELSPIGALRATLQEVFGSAGASELAKQNERAELILAVPVLRMRMLDEAARSIQALARVIARRAGRAEDDFEVRTLAGAAIGALLAVWAAGGGSKLGADYLVLTDRALAHLEGGLKL